MRLLWTVEDAGPYKITFLLVGVDVLDDPRFLTHTNQQKLYVVLLIHPGAKEETDSSESVSSFVHPNKTSTTSIKQKPPRSA